MPRELAEHSLHVRPDVKPVKQPLRRFAEEKRKIIGDEVVRLLTAGFIKEVLHPDWVANPVLVEKKKDEPKPGDVKVWRMCIDYTNLNKACPKDPFPLPRIDQVIDSTAGCELLSFVDAFSGFHQIPLNPDDQIKTAFITPHGVYCYVTMPFGLRNACATYQRCMQKCLHDQLGINVQVYVDDVVIKTKTGDTLIDDLAQTFANLRRYRMKLNPAKCTFGVPAGKLLGFLVSSRGIEANPVKIRAIQRMELPKSVNDIQKFTGCLASLSRFVSRLGEKALPLYQLTKKSGAKFAWTPQADSAFQELKKLLTSAPILASPLPKEPMLLYVAATNRVVSAVIVVEREEKGELIQRPVYYLSEVLSTSKQNYPHYQKMTYGVYMAAKKLKHYFEEHPIRVICSAPISDIVNNRDASGRIAKWAIELAPYTPKFERREAIKSQALADFLVDWAEMQYQPPPHDPNYWVLHFDGSKVKEGLGAGVVLTSPKGDQLKYVLQIHFEASNNVAEYEALVHGLKVAKEIGIRRIQCFGDSDLVVQQVSGNWDALDANMALYRFHVQMISGYFKGCEFRHIPRAENQAADELSKLGSSRQFIPPGVSLEHLRKPSIKPSPESESIFVPKVPKQGPEPMEIDWEGGSSDLGTRPDLPGTRPKHPGATSTDPGTSSLAPAESTMAEPMEILDAVFVVHVTQSWSRFIQSFLVHGELPNDETLAEQVHRKAEAYTVINGELCRRNIKRVPAECMMAEPMQIDETIFVVNQVPSWGEPIITFLTSGVLPNDEVSARQVQRRSKAYTIINGELYKRSVTSVLQRCVSSAEGQEILKDIHQGECGHHASSRALVAKAFRHGFYWPTALKEAEDLVRKCNGCQRYAHQIHTPAAALKTIPITWPFAVWGLDMVGPFRPARGNMTHILVMVDKFTKWIEVKPIRKCDGNTAVSFLKDIILRYGYPHSIITDNGTNFAEGAFARFCMDKKIRLDKASVAHPQGNGQVERSNGLVLSGIKPRLIEPLERSAGCWLDELPSVLWSLRTTPNRSTGYTPFFLVYGAEAVLPTDVVYDSPRIRQYTEAEVKEAREDDVDLLEEARELALTRSAIYQQNLRRYHSRKVCPRGFREGNMVLRLAQSTVGWHKLTPPWEGPFIVSRALHNDAYYLIDARTATKNKADRSGEETKRPWPIALLRPFYT